MRDFASRSAGTSAMRVRGASGFVVVTLALAGSLAATAAAAGTLQGRVTADDGRPLAGAMVTLTDAKRGLGESVYTDADGRYVLELRRISGRLALRVREPYYRDATDEVRVGAKQTVVRDVRLAALTDPTEISNQLPAAYHFGNLAFEDNGPFSRGQFQRDCITCHQVGNGATRTPRSAEVWEVTIDRMHKYLGNFDAGLRRRRSELLAAGLNGEPLQVRPVFPFDPEIAKAHVTQYRLDHAQLPHDAETSPDDGLVYISDQFGDQVIVTDLESGVSKYFPVPTDGRPVGGKFAKLGIPALGDAASRLHGGPHSLSIGPDGRWYTTDAFATQIGVFDPRKQAWEKPLDIPDGARMPSLYPHTIRQDATGKLWFTLTFSEQVARLDPATGKIDVIDLPPAKSLGVAAGTAPYGIDVDPKDGGIWYARLWGDRIGRVDPRTLQVTEFEAPVRGPRRLRFDRDGTMWLTGYNDGVVAELRTNGASAFWSRVHRLPEFAPGQRPAAYALNVSPFTGHVWVNETMTDRLYRYDPKHDRWTVYPMPLRGTYTREITFTKDGDVCTSNNPFPIGALEGGKAELICIDPGA